MSELRVVVIGSGISGLAAAWRLSRTGSPPEVIVLEGSGRTGGKLRVETVGGVDLDVGAESVLARRPEAVDLIREVGLGGELVHPAVSAASVLARGRLYPLPGGTVMGVPAGPGALLGLAGLLTAAEVARVAREPGIEAPALTEDVGVGGWVAGRMGRAVVDRLVEPLLGGVYAGHADQLSLQATVPALWQKAQRGGPVFEGESAQPDPARAQSDPAQAQAEPAQVQVAGAERRPAGGPAESAAVSAPPVAAAQPAGGPVFAGVSGGVGRLGTALTEGLRAAGVEIRTGTTVRGLRRTPTGWRLETGPAGSPRFLDADAVVLAVPPAAAARLLAADCPSAATELAGIETASVAVVAVAIRRVNSCLTFAVAQQHAEITTIEGLETDAGLHPVQQAFLDHDGYQCGYCTPGQICSAVGMLAEHADGWPSAVTAVDASAPALDASEVRERMSGNLCRCGAYANIVPAIVQAGRAR